MGSSLERTMPRPQYDKGQREGHLRVSERRWVIARGLILENPRPCGHADLRKSRFKILDFFSMLDYKGNPGRLRMSFLFQVKSKEIKWLT